MVKYDATMGKVMGGVGSWWWKLAISGARAESFVKVQGEVINIMALVISLCRSRSVIFAPVYLSETGRGGCWRSGSMGLCRCCH